MGTADTLPSVVPMLPVPPLRDRDGELMIRIDAFDGNDADRTLRILSSNKNRQLHPLEKAFGYQRLSRFGWDNTGIADSDRVSPQWVGKMLVLASSYLAN